MQNQLLISHLLRESSLGTFYIQHWHQIPFKNFLNAALPVWGKRTGRV